ncbi:pantoate--beta-alanine ligase [Desulfitobacterium hafniense]|uniref:Pantothenate synthetase n=3 Tax=Desulfitobacterium hafniense TaxID=49338 RepID=PANC_DESHY|nr:pantoate--beta-alanine ligase [Desulfitobacterium hafniense]B8FZE0.1 RecName: Full=Pantothenate synthetase; Short=PS; AltName: Full=Pantoate--beta-alanine ligase; AltName: Full=Pantoate-activating enzyme [Desulfitobacterium hafniense DCB-2]Q251P2.1 RecName: Full=Pantothenate synthetase; Short=PS; AltName: Full=Pantoate--beta-alanine ligase; AltName: Full=Pantoate-activating enzyme [Desulfitobacterium hafniense Y51]ACL18223.1 pantoate/beta-alanine ligase [Desulfitobacterium hafniense DCB-2]KT
MIICKKISAVRDIVKEQRGQGRSIALVPTMGYLHEGHLTLVEEARKSGAFVVMSIFVNPLQFGPNEDFARYPRDLERDAKKAEGAGVDLIFNPEVEEMYPAKNLTHVEVDELGDSLCGASRPGHFRGVTTVVSKLFHIVQPDRAYFGQKDYQQYLIICQMVKDLNFPIEVIGVPIVREEDGLALSSRNIYLSPEQRAEALVLQRSLGEAENWFRQGERSALSIEERIKELIRNESSGEIDYVEIRSAENLHRVEQIEGKIFIALAVRFGSTRLIDNKVLEGM